MKIFSPHVLNLTLVDLPGLTKVPIGDQPSDIEKQTRTLISEYIAKPNSIVLAVSPANVDIVNSEALKHARHVDPMGRRTIGVLTKIDLMDHGTNALDILSGRVYPLKLGFIGVVNRSQQDIQSNKPMADALKSEADFFRHHPAYRNMAVRCGTQYLARTLNTTLMAHIRDRLPDIKARLNTLMGQTQQELASYGSKQFSGKEHRGSLILQLMTRFATSFISSIDGTSSEISTKELCGGARIYYIFNSVFGNSLETIDPTQNLSVLDIRTAIRNSTGPRPSLFVPELAFDLLVKPQIKMLEIPSQRCVELVYEELIKICHTCGSTELSRFPRLQGKLIEVVSDLLRERLGPASGYVESLISIQRAYINTNHPNFLGAAAAMSSVIQSRNEKEKKNAQAEDRRKREKRRQKELGGVNGTATPEEDEEEEDKIQTLPTRLQSKTGRSMSPAIGRDRENGHGNMSGTLAGGQGNGTAKDSFLNYFFGKEGTLPAAGPPLPQPSQMGSRHVSHPIEPSFAQSIRRAERGSFAERSPLPHFGASQDEYGDSQYDGGYSLFVSISMPMHGCNILTSRFSPNNPQNHNSPIAKPSKQNSFAALFRHTSTSFARPSQIKCRRRSCICWSTTRETKYRTALSVNCTGKISSATSSMRMTGSRRREKSVRKCCPRIERQQGLWVRCSRTIALGGGNLAQSKKGRRGRLSCV